MAHKQRRTYGEGGITTRMRRGTLWHVVQLYVHEGYRRRRVEVWAKTEAEAKKKLRKLKADRERNELAKPDRTTLAGYLEQWNERRKSNVAPSTWLSYGATIRRHIKPFIGAKKLTEFEPSDALELYDELRRAKRGSNTIRRVHIILHKALRDAEGTELIRRNPVTAIPKPKHTGKTTDHYNLEEIRRFLHAVKGHKWEALWLLALYSQAREGEILALRREGVDFENGAIYVERGVRDVSYKEREIADPKTPTSKRRIDLPPEVMNALRKQCERLEKKSHLTPNSLIFPDRDGGVLRRSNLLRRHLYPLMDRARQCNDCKHCWTEASRLPFPGSRTQPREACPKCHSTDSPALRRITFHALRHSGATLLSSHVPLVVLKERLGHASIATTANVYVHRSPSMQREAATILSKLLAEESA